jgi:hypothetical protein
MRLAIEAGRSELTRTATSLQWSTSSQKRPHGANNDRPEQKEWWEETSRPFDDVTFHDLPDADVLDRGDWGNRQQVLATEFLSEVSGPLRQIFDGLTQLTRTLCGLRSALQQVQANRGFGVAPEDDAGYWDERERRPIPGWDEKEDGPLPYPPKPEKKDSTGGGGLEWLGVPAIAIFYLGYELFKGPQMISWGNFRWRRQHHRNRDARDDGLFHRHSQHAPHDGRLEGR